MQTSVSGLSPLPPTLVGDWCLKLEWETTEMSLFRLFWTLDWLGLKPGLGQLWRVWRERERERETDRQRKTEKREREREKREREREGERDRERRERDRERQRDRGRES